MPEAIAVDLIEPDLDDALGPERDPVVLHVRRPARRRALETSERARVDQEPGAPRVILEPDDQTAEVRLNFNPLVWWVWYGGMIMAIGGLIVMWPQAQRRGAQSGYVAPLEPGAVDGEPAAAGVTA